MWSFGVFRIGSRKTYYTDYILFSVCFYSADNFGNKRVSAQNSIYKDRNRKNAGKRTKVLEKEKTKTLAWFVFPLYINCRRSKRGNGTPTNSDWFRRIAKRKSTGAGRWKFVSDLPVNYMIFTAESAFPIFKISFLRLLTTFCNTLLLLSEL